MYSKDNYLYEVQNVNYIKISNIIALRKKKKPRPLCKTHFLHLKIIIYKICIKNLSV